MSTTILVSLVALAKMLAIIGGVMLVLGDVIDLLRTDRPPLSWFDRLVTALHLLVAAALVAAGFATPLPA